MILFWFYRSGFAFRWVWIAILFISSVSAQESRPKDRFNQLDRNGDGKLDQSEAGRLPFFNASDRDEDGFVTWEELVERFRAMWSQPEKEQSEGILPLPATAPLAKRAANAADYSESCGGTAVVVLQEGDLVFERYAGEADPETPHHLHSGTKGFWGPVVAAMIEDGLVSSFDELAAETLTEWRDHPRKKTITLRHLLQLNAGLAQDLVKLQGHSRPTLADDLYEHAVSLACWFSPGERFAYGPSCYYALGAVLERKLAGREQTPLDYLKERILEPIGVEHGKWVHDDSGNPHIPNGAWLTARDWARYGQFLLQEGTWEGKEIVSFALIRELREPSEANQGHGLALWLNRPGGFPPARQRFDPDSKAVGGFLYPEGEPGLYAALGAGKNRLYIIPSKSLVVARQTPKDTTDFEDSEFLRRILGKPTPMAANPGPKLFDRNGDDRLEQDEVPPALARLFEYRKADADGDGVITAEEAARFKLPGQGRGNLRGSGSVEVKPNRDASRPHGEEASAAGLNPDVLAELDATLQGHVDARNVSGVIGLINRNGHCGYFEAFGWQDIEAEKPMPKNAIFRLQSMSKPVVTAAALTLFEEGLFTLDEPISKHLPEWNQPKVFEEGELVPARTAITPRMLMSHSSGLYYGRIEGAPGSDRGWVISRDEPITLETHSKALAAQPLKFHPGEGFSYGTSIDVLGRYIEVVAGKPLDEIVMDGILKPLKMIDTDFWVYPEKADRIAQIYRQSKPGELVRGREAAQLTNKPTIFLGGQGLCGPTEDYARFCRMMLSGGEIDGVRVLEAKTVDMMFANHLEDIGESYGLGGAVNDGGYAWGGANGTQFWIDRNEDYFAVFMVQTQRYRASTINDFRRLVKEAIGSES